jgi:hypothetical protein
MSSTMQRRAHLALVAALSLSFVASVGCVRPRPPVPPTTTTTTTPGSTTPPPPVTDYAAPGPAAATTTVIGENTYYYPTNLAVGAPHPVIIWGNGTSATPSVYAGFLTHLATHGFIVAAANTTNAGSGREMLAGLDYLTTANGQAGNRFFGAVDTSRVGSSGHSQGAFGSVVTLADPRISTAFPLAGARAVNNPGKSVLFFAGQNDTIVSPTGVRSAFTGSTAPAAYAELAGATHFTELGNGGGFRGASTAWARWRLMGDTRARAMFVGAACGLCNNPAWSTYQANAALQALS